VHTAIAWVVWASILPSAQVGVFGVLVCGFRTCIKEFVQAFFKLAIDFAQATASFAQAFFKLATNFAQAIADFARALSDSVLRFWQDVFGAPNPVGLNKLPVSYALC
jgi:ABC-type molybdate transport system permease subunit